jgi:tetratricopeptide (TPR) repeat protein
MDIASTFIIYLTVFRLAIIASGLVSIILGYRLFVRGVWPKGANKGTAVDAKIAGSQLTMKNAAPGTCLALFGAIIVSVMFASGGPELTLNMLEKASQMEKNAASGESRADSSSSQWFLKMRGEERGGISTLTAQGIFYEGQRDTANAITAYQNAVALVATPMNHLAWLYQAKGRLEEALPLSRLAVQLAPDNADFLDTLAEILSKSGKRAEALPLWRKAARLNPKYQPKLAEFERRR